MLLKNVKISRQLSLGLGLILLFVALLGGMAWYLTESLWQNTADMYNHPLTIRRAIAEFEADILRMNLALNDLALAEGEEEILLLQQRIEIHQNNALEIIEVFYQQYLGPVSDVDLVKQGFTEWQVILNDAVRLAREGRQDEVMQCLKSTEPCGEQVENLVAALETVSNFALGKGNEFYQDARQQRQSMVVGLWILLGSILLLTLAITILLIRNINTPLRTLTAAMQAFQRGEYDTRSEYGLRNEFGRLADGFNQLAEYIQRELLHRQHQQEIAEIMLRSRDLQNFCLHVLHSLLQYTDSQAGAVYLLNAAQTEFEPYSAIGFEEDALRSFSAEAPAGEFGTCLVSQEIEMVREIPADTRQVFSTVSGDFLPRAVMTIPILSEGQVIAMISLASLRDYSPAAVQLVQDVWRVLTARLNGVLLVEKVRQVSAQLEQQNHELAAQARELETQTHELRMQSDELAEQNIELDMQKRQVDEANRLKTNFLSNMSHELRTPLNSVIALAEVLERRLNGKVPPTEFGYLQVIERNGRHLLEIINDILDLSRIEAGREELDLAPVSVAELIEAVVVMVEPLAREQGISLRHSLDGALPSIRSDAVKLRHILQNLVGNAVKFTPRGEVTVSAVTHGHQLQIAVRDTGIGIAADQLPFIFDEFRQADDSFSRQFGGSGLGLAIAKKYALLLGGQISVESTLGVGSTFTLSLPLQREDSPWQNPGRSEHERRQLQGSVDCSGKDILLVEDSEPAVIQMTDILTAEGCQVRAAKNGREALAEIARALPDAVILDLMMPEVDGFEVLKMIRSQAQTAELPVLILTAKHVTREELRFLKGNHIHQLVQKGSINRESLLAVIRRMVAPAAAPRQASGPGTEKRQQKPLVLVVEDHPDNQTAVQALLGDFCELAQALDGQTGMDMALALQPDLMLVDITLPLKSGIEVLEAIRAEESLRHVPVVAMTARAMKGDDDKLMAIGFDAYIAKPVDGELLKHTIEELLYGG